VAKLGAVVADMNKAKSQRSQLEAERRKIAEDQDRIRRNLESAGQASDLGRRYLDMLKTQEDRLAEIDRVDQASKRRLPPGASPPSSLPGSLRSNIRNHCAVVNGPKSDTQRPDVGGFHCWCQKLRLT